MFRLTFIPLLYLGALGWAQFAPMAMMNKKTAVAVVNTSAAHNATVTASQVYTLPSSTAGNTLIIGVGGGAGLTVSSVTDNSSNTWVSAGARAETTNGYGDFTDIWYAANCKAGTTTITVHLSSASDLVGWAAEVSGLNKTSPLDTAAIATKVVTNPYVGPSVTTTGSYSEFIITVTNVDTNITAVASPYTFMTQENGNGAAYRITTAVGATAPSFTATAGTSSWSASSTAAFKP